MATIFTEVGWNGTSGYCAHDGKYGLILRKPLFSFEFDALNFSSDDSVPDFKILNRLPYALPSQEIAELTAYAIANSDKDQGGGGGGSGGGLTPEQSAWLEERKNDPRFITVIDDWFTDRRNDPKFTKELSDWLTARWSDPRFDAAAKSINSEVGLRLADINEMIPWFTERKDDPRYTGQGGGGGGGTGGFTDEMEAWLTTRMSDPRFTDALSALVTEWANWKAKGIALEEAMAKIEPWWAIRKDDARLSLADYGWIQARKNDPRYVTEHDNWWSTRKLDPRFTSALYDKVMNGSGGGGSGGGTDSAHTAVHHTYGLTTRELATYTSLVYQGGDPISVQLPTIVAGSPVAGLDVKAGIPITLINRSDMGGTITLTDPTGARIHVGDVNGVTSLAIRFGESVCLLPAMAEGIYPQWEVVRRSSVLVNSLTDSEADWLKLFRPKSGRWGTPTDLISHGKTRG